MIGSAPAELGQLIGMPHYTDVRHALISEKDTEIIG